MDVRTHEVENAEERQLERMSCRTEEWLKEIGLIPQDHPQAKQVLKRNYMVSFECLFSLGMILEYEPNSLKWRRVAKKN